MGEPDKAVGLFEDALVERLLQDVPPDEIRRRPAVRRDKQELGSCRRREGLELRREQVFDARRHAQRLRQIDGGVEGSSELQGEEGIAGRRFMDPEDRRASERGAESLLEQRLRRTKTERAYREALAVERIFDSGPGRTSPRQQDQNAIGRASAESKLETGQRKLVTPLRVIDGDKNRGRRGKQLEDIPQPDAKRKRVGVLRAGLTPYQRNLERRTPGRRERGERIIDHALQEIAKDRVWKVALHLCGPRQQDAKPVVASALEASHEELRFADSGFAFERQHRRRFWQIAIDEGRYRGQLLVSAHDR
jgi:hypothetical protein